jgi:hypothetical protein
MSCLERRKVAAGTSRLDRSAKCWSRARASLCQKLSRFAALTPRGSSTGTTLIEVSPIAQFTGPNVRLRAYEFETDRTPSS